MIAGCQVSVVGENRARVFGAAAACQRCVQLDFQMHEQRAGSVKKECTCIFAFDGAAAEGQHEIFARQQPGNCSVFVVAKGVFPVTRKDVSDSGSCFGFNDVVDINELPAKARGDEWTDCRFA